MEGIKNTLYDLFQLEKEKYSDKNIWKVLSLILLLSLSYFFPKLALLIYREFLGHENYSLYVIGNFFVHLIAYTIIHSAFALVYLSNSNFIQSYKHTSDPWLWESDPEFKSKLYLVLKSFMVNQFILVPLLSMILGFKAYFITDPDLFPSPLVNFLQIIFFIIAEDSSGFCIHRLLHTPRFYKLFHKKHHEFIMPISVAAEYAHPIEFTMSNIVPLTVGPLLYGHHRIHIVTWFVWVFFRMYHTAELHCGFYIPWSPVRLIPFGATALFHDNHHSKNVGNYGNFFMLWDSLIGTNGLIKKKP